MRKTLLSFLSLLLGVMAMNAAQPSGTLPVMYITTEGNAPITSKEDYVKGSYYLDPKGVEGVEAFGTAAKPLALQIRGRGNWTWAGFEKKPYRLKLDKKAALFGEAKSKHWALLAHADDNKGFLRNAVGFQVSRLIGLPWTPCHHPVEVVLNGDYIGLYFLTETVRVDKDRVDVFDYDSAYEDYADANPGQTLPWDEAYATGGWLCEIDNYDDPCQIKFNSVESRVYDNTLRITYDTPSDYITEAHKEWLKKEMTELDEMIVNGDRAKCEWANKIDITDMARFYVVNQILYNYESFAGSCKLWREKGEDSKWHFGPVWDFGSAFQTDDVTHFFFEWGPYSNHWIGSMYEYPAFKAEVVKVYKELMDNGYSTIDSFIDEYLASIKSAANSDYERWSNKGYGNNDLDNDREFVKRCLSRSVNWLNYTWLGTDYDDEVLKPSTAIYLRGDMNGWGAEEAYKFTEAEDGTYRLFVNKLTGSFKLAGPVWGEGNVNYGIASAIDLDKEYELQPSGGNISLKCETATNVTLIFNWEKKTLLVTMHPDQEIDDTNSYTVYFSNTHAQPWDNVKVFTFGPMLHGEWPGTDAEKVTVNGQEYWKHTFEKKHNDGDICLIFNNGNSGKGTNQTADLPIHHNGIYNLNGFTGKYMAAESAVETVEAVDANAPVEYYNLQGIRISEPSNGIYIRRQGNRANLIRK